MEKMGNQGISRSSAARARFSDYYVPGERIGCGTFAVVRKCHRKDAPQQQFAVKIVDKRRLTSRELVGLKYEIKILRIMNHPSVLKAVDVFENKNKVKIVLELCEGGNLFDQLLQLKKKRMDEKTAAWIVCKTARALKHLHEHYVCHRDLKPENILFTKNGNVKITDLGLAHYLKLPPKLHTMHTCCGTPHYVAPEVLACAEYGVQADFWSLGVILYVLLSGYQPFNSKSIRAMYGMITRGEYRFLKAHWSHVSPEAISCVKALMNVDPNRRLNCDSLCKHPFILKHVNLKEIEQQEDELLQEQQNWLKNSSPILKLKDLKRTSRGLTKVKAGYSMQMKKKKMLQDKFKEKQKEKNKLLSVGKLSTGIYIEDQENKRKQTSTKSKTSSALYRTNTVPIFSKIVKKGATETRENNGL